VFKQVDAEFLSNARQDCSPDGSTCLMGLVLNGRLTVANLGDSIATLIHENGDLTKMNTIHEPTRPDEKSRIEAANGFVIKNRVNGELSVSRAFGDFEMKELIISDPECQTI
jgi:protein phosphatase 1L